MHIRHLLIIIICFVLVNTAESQIRSYSYVKMWPNFDSTQAGNLTGRVENLFFFRNTEYKSIIVDGYTLIGTWGRFLVQYQPSHNLRIRGGLHLLKYHGRDESSDMISMPYYAIEYWLRKDLSLTFGNFSNDENLGLLEVLYEPENFYRDGDPAGVKVDFKKDRFYFNMWIDWEKLVLRNDPFQEEFTNTIVTEYFLFKNSNYELSVPVQLMFNHRGGEIQSLKANIKTTMNGATGLKTLMYNGQWGYGLNAYYTGWKELTSHREVGVAVGQGELIRLFVALDKSTFSLGYWHGYNYYSPKGRRIYQSVSYNWPGYLFSSRQLWEARLNYVYTVYKGVHLALEGEAYYDIRHQEFSYCWGLYLKFSESFFIKNFKKKDIN